MSTENKLKRQNKALCPVQNQPVVSPVDLLSRRHSLGCQHSTGQSAEAQLS